MIEQKNHLLNEKSPYLLQHKENPVHWFAWGEEAFKVAREENKPIFLSIGYSTCHWCHVMAHESFEDQAVADLLNQNFISIKVDREERPDVDEIYMAAVHAMGQRGGWPLSMFLNIDLKPFYGGTYWPKEHFKKILQELSRVWREEPEKIQKSGESIFEHLKNQKTGSLESAALSNEIFEKFYQHSEAMFDPHFGGFGSAPKFPHSMQMSMLLRITQFPLSSSSVEGKIAMVQTSLERMARGGIYDHLGGGFARYSTDERWLVPHFEKMLYDNALLVRTYLEAYQVTKNEMFTSVTKEILDYVLRVMTHPEGGFYSAEDADSDGVEGKFYVWKETELKTVLSSKEFELFCKVYGISSSGNFEGENILSLQPGYDWSIKQNPLLISAQQKLFEIREKRIHPHKDDKILTSWNGLMISAMALGYQVLGDERYLKAAEKSAQFIKNHLFLGAHGHAPLQARYRDGEGRFSAYLDDYAFLIQGLIDLYESNFDPNILKWGLELQKIQNDLFWDQSDGAYFFTDGNDSTLLIRSKEATDGALPNGNAVSALNLLRLYHLNFEEEFSKKAQDIFRFFSKLIGEYPQAFSQMLIAYVFQNHSKEIAILEKMEDSVAKQFLKEIYQNFYPNKVMVKGVVPSSFPLLLNGKDLIDQKTAFYICEKQSCQKPTSDFKEAFNLLRG